MNDIQTYEEWYDLNENEIWIELSEIGADRELDFNPESEFETRYENYINQNITRGEGGDHSGRDGNVADVGHAKRAGNCREGPDKD